METGLVMLMASTAAGEAGVLGASGYIAVLWTVLNRVPQPLEEPERLVLELQAYNGRAKPDKLAIYIARQALLGREHFQRFAGDVGYSWVVQGQPVFVLSNEDVKKLGFPPPEVYIGRGCWGLNLYRSWLGPLTGTEQKTKK